MKEMKAEGVPPDVVPYNNSICCLCKEGSVKKAVSLLDEMTQTAVVPNITSYRTILTRALCRTGEFDAA